MLKVLLTRPPLPAVSGVSAFYRAVEPHISLQAEVVPVDIGSLTSRSIHFLGDQMKYRETLAGSSVDLVHLNPSLTSRSIMRDGFFISAAKRAGLPVLVHIHGWEHHTADRIESGPLGAFFRRTLGRGDAFVVLADEFGERLRSWGVAGPVHHGTTAVDEGLLEGFDIEERQTRYSPSERLRVLFLARVEKEKGIYETVDACARLVDEGLPLRLTVAGEGSELPNVRTVAGEKLGDRVSFEGFILGERKARALRENDLYVLPTYHAEGMPASVLEAMALGLPVITRPMGGIKDFFLDGEHGFLMEEVDAGVVASRIRELASNEELWRRMSRTAHEYATRRFLGSRVADHLVGIYREITGGEA
ncbi:MAG: glycosyltransferase [Candidatus Eisenbacteria bacterium]|nr:glycosyltransferase [Candidatus Eisenbacteria bacterium]